MSFVPCFCLFVWFVWFFFVFFFCFVLFLFSWILDFILSQKCWKCVVNRLLVCVAGMGRRPEECGSLFGKLHMILRSNKEIGGLSLNVFGVLMWLSFRGLILIALTDSTHPLIICNPIFILDYWCFTCLIQYNLWI